MRALGGRSARSGTRAAPRRRRGALPLPPRRGRRRSVRSAPQRDRSDRIGSAPRSSRPPRRPDGRRGATVCPTCRRCSHPLPGAPGPGRDGRLDDRDEEPPDAICFPLPRASHPAQVPARSPSHLRRAPPPPAPTVPDAQRRTGSAPRRSHLASSAIGPSARTPSPSPLRAHGWGRRPGAPSRTSSQLAPGRPGPRVGATTRRRDEEPPDAICVPLSRGANAAQLPSPLRRDRHARRRRGRRPVPGRDDARRPDPTRADEVDEMRSLPTRSPSYRRASPTRRRSPPPPARSPSPLGPERHGCRRRRRSPASEPSAALISVPERPEHRRRSPSPTAPRHP